MGQQREAWAPVIGAVQGLQYITAHRAKPLSASAQYIASARRSLDCVVRAGHLVSYRFYVVHGGLEILSILLYLLFDCVQLALNIVKTGIEGPHRLRVVQRGPAGRQWCSLPAHARSLKASLAGVPVSRGNLKPRAHPEFFTVIATSPVL